MVAPSTLAIPFWPIDLSERPHISLGALTVHNRAGGFVTEHFLLPDLWCLHLYRYHGRVEIPGHQLRIHPGSLTIFPLGLPMTYHFQGVSEHFFLHFHLAPSTDSARRVVAHQETGADNQRFTTELEQIIEATRSQPLRAEVKLWELLFTLSEQEPVHSNQHPSLQKALRLVEDGLADSLSPAQIAREVGLSHNHLIRLFQQETGGTISAYIRGRRAERACHLLENTTLPLASVAAQVGVEPGKGLCDLLKRETGRSPRQWRQR